MQTCTECGKPLRQVPAGVSKNTGRPYKAFMACPDRHKQVSQQKEEPQYKPTGKDANTEMLLNLTYEVQEIRKVVDWLQLNLIQQGKEKIGKGFDAEKGEIPIVEEQEDEELKNIPF